MDVSPFTAVATLGVLFIASLIDMKTREVPDIISYGLIAIGFGTSAIISVLSSSFMPLIASVIGSGICFAIGWVLYLLGQWGGGDSKLITGVGAMIGLPIMFSIDGAMDALFHSVLINFLINIIFVGAAYALVWTFFLAIRDWRCVSAHTRKILNSSKRWRQLALIGIIILAIGSPLLFTGPEIYFVYLLIALIVAYLYGYAFIKAVEEEAMKPWVSPEKITEGEWICEPIVIGKKTIAGPHDRSGITREQLHDIQRLHKLGKIKTVRIKQGIPFVPTFFFALLTTLMLGNVVALLFAF